MHHLHSAPVGQKCHLWSTFLLFLFIFFTLPIGYAPPALASVGQQCHHKGFPIFLTCTSALRLTLSCIFRYAPAAVSHSHLKQYQKHLQTFLTNKKLQTSLLHLCLLCCVVCCRVLAQCLLCCVVCCRVLAQCWNNFLLLLRPACASGQACRATSCKPIIRTHRDEDTQMMRIPMMRIPIIRSHRDEDTQMK